MRKRDLRKRDLIFLRKPMVAVVVDFLLSEGCVVGVCVVVDASGVEGAS